MFFWSERGWARVKKEKDWREQRWFWISKTLRPGLSEERLNNKQRLAQETDLNKTDCNLFAFEQR